ncbi:MAG: GHMP kinase [Candidatus Heimdallarchaeota archaeon]
MIIRSKAPFRISFGGGGTDLPPYCTEHGGCVINTAIDRHVYISVSPRNDKRIRIVSTNLNEQFEFNVKDNNYSNGYELFKGTINVLDISDGFDINIYSELPAGSGMGGSSTLVVALIGAFNEYYQNELTKHEIAQKAYEIERIELEQKGGYQDQFAAAYGGFNFMEFTDKAKISPVDTTEQILNELQFRLVLCYVGGSHFSSDIQDEVLEGYKDERKTFIETMQDLKDVAYEMKALIESKDVNQLTKFGELLHKGWMSKKSLSSKISSKNIENFYLTSRKFGVIGGKLLGAGGGGHLLLFSDPEKKFNVINELKKIGGTIVNFHFNPKGLEVWRLGS